MRVSQTLLKRQELTSQSRIGKSMGVDRIDGEIEGFEDMSRMLKDWSIKYKEKPLQPNEVCWLNEPCYQYHKQIAYIAYGNEHTEGMLYSECVILAEVPRFEDRIIDASV
ncbi:hypothetical protein F4679DRAFT_588726 [Xylaria curta]|nr:hypothetical protein F4679DRAFT_588726 [Xylaria curta]